MSILKIATVFEKFHAQTKVFPKMEVKASTIFMNDTQLRNLTLDPDLDSWMGFNRQDIIDKAVIQQTLGCGIFTDKRLGDEEIDICYNYKDIVRTKF